tara:strand:+ start:1007 stop:1504 length:498 start_codon:yes stop_codon:yes gene_type:complete
MTDRSELTESDIKKIKNLIEIEDIKKMRLHYSYFMDIRDLDKLMEVFAEGALCEYGPYGEWRGKETILNNYKETFKETMDNPFASMHVNTNHLVEITGPTSAKGRVYLVDIVTDVKPDENPFLWFALYDEEYEKIDNSWKIKRTSLEFFWPERHVQDNIIPGEFI